jgi:hypothetical protein
MYSLGGTVRAHPIPDASVSNGVSPVATLGETRSAGHRPPPGTAVRPSADRGRVSELDLIGRALVPYTCQSSWRYPPQTAADSVRKTISEPCAML